MSAEAKTCNCNCEKICCEMQKNSLRLAVRELKDSYESIHRVQAILSSLTDVLKVYECSPYKCLLTRIQWVSSNLNKNLLGGVVLQDRVKIDMLIVEIKTFVNN